ncbi:unnamed protein product [Rotaria sp. Silwood2]|nr:unnamed protein product [Rotaria sp. Silwood2]CAF3387715.1 unnamed protein product [Rotaria sp. Silwood2]CAF3537031.1 unnamed protein product [Rotaria sp. Silwood2]CAF4564960.1 unnamed protein product [Rotaria sp. Silwood2]CAF4580880.1 unnamed protein product [Rotaria sp. Silwood2]
MTSSTTQLTADRLCEQSVSAFYLIVELISDCGVLVIGSLSRLRLVLFPFDPTRIFLIWCKLESPIRQLFGLISLTSVIFAAIDQYLSTNYRDYLKQLSTLKLAQRLTCISIIVWVLHNIPFMIFYDILPYFGCDIYDDAFRKYYLFFYLPFLNGILPIGSASFFSLLAYRNVRHLVRLQIPIVRRHFDRQLTAMVLTRVVFLDACLLLFVMQRIYRLSVTTNLNDTLQIVIEQFIATFALSLSNCNFAVRNFLFRKTYSIFFLNYVS